MAAGVPEIYAARAAHVGRGLLRTYEANRECVKTPGKRWLLDEYYAGLEKLLLACESRARDLEAGDVPEAVAA